MKAKKPQRKNSIFLIIICCAAIGVAIAASFFVVEYRERDKSKDYSTPSSSREFYRGQPIEEKPIIYLYSSEERELTVKLGRPEGLTVSYPEYPEEGWKVFARPDGTLTDLASGRTLYSLYWEGTRLEEPEFLDGFVVSREETISFLEEKLALLGLSEREAEEFIVYWLPRLKESEFNLIRFETLDAINQECRLRYSTRKAEELNRTL